MVKPILVRNLSLIILFLFVQFALCQSNSSLQTVEDYIELCKTNLDSNKPLEAIKFGEKAVKLDENNADAHYWLGEAYISSIMEVSKLKIFSQVKKSKAEWEKAADLDKNHVKARESLINFHLGAPGILGGDKDEAKQLAHEIFTVDSLEGHLAFGLIHEKNEEYGEAEDEYRTVIAINSDLSQGYSRLGDLYVKQKKYNDARAMYNKIIEIDKDNSEGYYKLGNCSIESERELEDGIMYFETCLKKEPKMLEGLKAHIHCKIGNIHEILNDDMSAKEEFNIALKLDPKNKEAKKALKELK